MEVPAPDSAFRTSVPPVRESTAPTTRGRVETPAGLASPTSGVRTRVLFTVVGVAMLVIAGMMAMNGDGMDLFMAAVAACFAGVLGYLALTRREPADSESPRVAGQTSERPAGPSSDELSWREL